MWREIKTGDDCFACKEAVICNQLFGVQTDKVWLDKDCGFCSAIYFGCDFETRKTNLVEKLLSHHKGADG
jgi:hypothetical protein